MRYYISDCHFFHEGMNDRMDKRGFASVDEMNSVMAEKWNSRVRKNDEVIILGDFSWELSPKTTILLRSLKGKKYMIRGNHDRFLDDRTFNREYFGWIEDYKEMNDNGRKVILSHYPVFCYNYQLRRKEDGSPRTYMLYGHVHNTYDEVLVNRFINGTKATSMANYGGKEEDMLPCEMINCFAMFSDYIPLTLDEWIELDKKRRAEMNKGDII